MKAETLYLSRIGKYSIAIHRDFKRPSVIFSLAIFFFFFSARKIVNDTKGRHRTGKYRCHPIGRSLRGRDRSGGILIYIRFLRYSGFLLIPVVLRVRGLCIIILILMRKHMLFKIKDILLKLIKILHRYQQFIYTMFLFWHPCSRRFKTPAVK